MRYQAPLLYEGEARFATISKWLAFLICLLLTVGNIVENVFFGNPSSMEYFSFFNDLSINLHEFETFVTRINVILVAISNIMEFICFIIISYEMLKLHLNRVRLNVVAHGRKNVITAMGHFLSWFIEIIAVALSSSTVFGKNVGLAQWIIVMLYPSINYIFPTIQILTSPELRDNVFGSNCIQYCKCDLEKSESAVVEIAMSNINNNNNAPHNIGVMQV